jgi:hypothetical protein
MGNEPQTADPLENRKNALARCRECELLGRQDLLGKADADLIATSRRLITARQR